MVSFVQLLVKLLEGRKLPHEGLHWLLKVTSTLLMSTAVQIELRHRTDIVTAVSVSNTSWPTLSYFK